MKAWTFSILSLGSEPVISIAKEARQSAIANFVIIQLSILADVGLKPLFCYSGLDSVRTLDPNLRLGRITELVCQ